MIFQIMVHFWLCLLALVASVHAFPKDQIKDTNIERRSLFANWRLILRGARGCGLCGNRKAYQKSGGLQQAYADFDLLDPIDVKIYGDGSKSGFVGPSQRLVHLETGEIPSIYITRKKASATNKRGKTSEIFYFKHMPDENSKNWQNIKW